MKHLIPLLSCSLSLSEVIRDLLRDISLELKDSGNEKNVEAARDIYRHLQQVREHNVKALDELSKLASEVYQESDFREDV